MTNARVIKDRGCDMLYRLESPLRQICEIGLYKYNGLDKQFDDVTFGFRKL